MYEQLDHGIFCLETGYQRPGLACAYLMVDHGEAAIIETGTARSVPLLLEGLTRAGIAPEQVRYVIPTHVHLDHAGGAGALLQHLPVATLLNCMARSWPRPRSACAKHPTTAAGSSASATS